MIIICKRAKDKLVHEKLQEIPDYSTEELSKFNLSDKYKGNEKSHKAFIECITRDIEDLAIRHSSSDISEYVTVSIGVVTVYTIGLLSLEQAEYEEWLKTIAERYEDI